MKSAFLFQMCPYAAVVFSAAGMAVRYLVMREPLLAKRPWPLDMRALFVGTRLLQISLLLLFLGHLAGLVFPQRILHWNNTPSRLYALEMSAFAVGLAALAGWALVMWRHLGRSDGSIQRQAAVAVFLSLLFTALLSGSLTAILYRWGSSWGVFTLTPYAVSLLRGRPAVKLVTDLPFLVRLHVFSAFATLAALPGTRVAPVLIVALSRAMRLIVVPVQGLIDSASRMVDVVARRFNPAIWIWPEDE